jgi:hypothetical protein
MKILIPHLDYFVYVKDISEGKGQPVWAEAFCQADENSKECTIYLAKNKKIPVELLAHEVLHAVQFICRRRNINMNDELENVGYLMQYIMHRICQEYPITKPAVKIK